MPSDAAPDSTRPPPAAPKASRAWLRLTWLGAGLLLLPLLLVGALLLATHSERGSRLLWQLGLHASSGRLAGTWVGGTLAQGAQLRDLRYRDGALQVSLDRFDGGWRLGVAPLSLRIDHLRLGRLELQLPPAAPGAPPMPQDLQLPLALQLRELSVNQLTLHGGSLPLEIGHLRLHASSDRRQHRLTLEQADTPYGQASARLQLDGQAPFAVGGGAELAGSYHDETYRLAANWSGTLAALALEVNASGDKLNGQAQIELAPFALQPLQRAKVSAEHINPKLFAPGAPQADLALHADLVPASPAAAGDDGALTVSGPITLRNAMPGPLDRDRLPLVSASLQARLNERTQQLAQIEIKLLRDAVLSGAGELRQASDGSRGEFQLQARALDLHALHAGLKPTQLRGPLVVRLQPEAQYITLALADALYQVQLEARLEPERIVLQQARLQAGAARLQLSGTLVRDAQMAYAVTGKLADFDPAQWIEAGKRGRRAPPARINLDFDAGGALTPLRLKFKFDVHDSSYDRLPLSGGGTLNLAGTRLLPSAVQLDVAGNRLALSGSFGAAGDRLQVKLDAPQLGRLGYGLEGLLQLDGELAGTLRQPQLRANYRAEHLALGAQRLAALAGSAELDGMPGGAAQPPLRLALKLDAHGYRGPQAALEQLHLQLSGTDRQHSFEAEGRGKLRGQPLELALAARGGLAHGKHGYRWDGVLDRLENRGQPRFALQAPLTLSAAADRLQLGATRLALAEATLDLKNFLWEPGTLHSEGTLGGLALANLLQLQQQFTGQKAPLKTDLVFDASWNFTLGEQAAGFASLARRSGDIGLEGGRGAGALGLSTLQLRADVQGGALRLDLQAAAARIGSLSAQASAGLRRQGGQLLPAADAPLAGQVKVRVPRLNTVAALAGPELALEGSLALDLELAGTAAQPQWSGTIAGDRLALTMFDLGIQLRDGTVRIGLDQNAIDLRQIEFHGGAGTLRASGRVQVGESDPALAATIVADRLQLFASPDRRLTLSGQAKVAHIAQQLRIDGKLTVDQALFDLPKKSAPELGDDVIVVRRQKEGDGRPAAQPIGAGAQKPAGRWAPVTDIEVDLGRDFRFRGSGAELLLRGNMALHGEPYLPLRATGTVRVTEGSYEAFGRRLAIERGLLNFQGPLDNPNINILAMRRNQEVEAGVEVTGLAQQPRVRLVSEPNVGDEEKLSWLMFGHGSDSSGLGQRQAAGAALALLGNAGGKRIAQGIGLDEFSIGASESGLADQQVVNLGKAISERFFVGYEQSLTGAASIVKLTWQFSRRWSLVARAGAISGLDVLFNRRFD